jgi:hypothetical protein
MVMSDQMAVVLETSADPKLGSSSAVDVVRVPAVTVKPETESVAPA